MDLASLREAASNLTLYDLKAGVRKVQNAVMNYTEMEAKVREATNNEPWGASSSLMQEIANGTYNYQLLNEIMPMIYKRFTEKAAEEWRQIYKALQLLEFLIKNGSERVIDDARSHLTLLKMLRQFHFIDANGKDQGVNVRNRAKELAELLSDVDKIRAERKKARATRNKYTGVEGGAGLGGGLSSSSRYGGFGSEETSSGGGGGYGGYSGGVYGDGGGFGGQTSDFQDSSSRDHSATGRRGDKFEYDEYDEGAVAAPSRRQADTATSSSSRRKTTERAAAKKPEPPKKEPEVDLFSFDDPIPTSAPIAAPTASNTVADDDDFDDFQSATPSVQTSAPSFPAAPTATTTSTTQYAAPQPVSAPKAANLTDLVGFSSISPATSTNPTPINYSAFSPPVVAQQPPRPTGYQGAQPNYFTSVQAPANQGQASSATSSVKSPAASKPAAGGDAFGSLWSSASAGIKKTSTPTSGPALGQLAKEKASAGIWGAGSSTSSTTMAQQQRPAQAQQSLGNGLDDLLG
ncbi:ENTH-domain-containing protein [Mollisia scopiformis]|uniref:ENTH-domain-containing protein n=1 Tax=Mollisia scopiformis TaxID=149040 RepID=A0A194XX14_MOLSC|nr:ENTH-domain-containing protein [Mollisia scopiformis]KUJ24312.1 ENTH-domain-containing protein [Mollisia scopiformis]